MKRFLTAVVLGAAMGCFNGALAHGEKPKHGGVLQVASDLAFELVPSSTGAIIYVEDHGKPYATSGMTGKLTVLNGTEKSEADLKPAGENKLEAQGVKVAKGAKAVASLSLPKKKTIAVRFAVR